MKREQTKTTIHKLAGELSTMKFSDKHPDVALRFAQQVWNAALDEATRALGAPANVTITLNQLRSL